MRSCQTNSDCSSVTQYCETNIGTCDSCAWLCDSNRNLQKQCHEHCYDYLKTTTTTSTTTEKLALAQSHIVRETEEAVSSHTSNHTPMMILTVLLAGLIFIGIAGLLTYFMMNYRKTSKRKNGKTNINVIEEQLPMQPRVSLTENNQYRQQLPEQPHSTEAMCVSLMSNERERADNTETRQPTMTRDIQDLADSRPSVCNNVYDEPSVPKGKNTQQDNGQNEQSHESHALCGKNIRQNNEQNEQSHHPNATCGNNTGQYNGQNERPQEKNDSGYNGSRDNSYQAESSSSSQTTISLENEPKQMRERRDSGTQTENGSECNNGNVSDLVSLAKSLDSGLRSGLDQIPEEITRQAEPMYVSSEEQGPQSYVRKKHIYETLRRMPFIEGYFSEGKTIQVFVDLVNLTGDWVMSELERETGQDKSIFQLRHRTEQE